MLKPAGPILIRITAPHFCAGIEWPVRYAPILSYMKLWSLKSIEQYCNKKGWRFEVVEGDYDGR